MSAGSAIYISTVLRGRESVADSSFVICRIMLMVISVSRLLIMLIRLLMFIVFV